MNGMTRRRTIAWSAALVLAAAVCLLAAGPATANTVPLERAKVKPVSAAAFDHLKAFLCAHSKQGFAKRVSFGALERYRDRLLRAKLVVKTKGSGVSGLAQYDPKKNTITFTRDPRKLGVKGTKMGETIWRELTRALEHKMDENPIPGDKLYTKRNVDYMTYVATKAVPWLYRLEKEAKAGASVSKLRTCWSTFLNEMEKAGNLPSAIAYPPDLELMRSWFGFRVNPEEIRALYLSEAVLPGKQGANLRKALTPIPQTWTGRWEVDWALGDWVLTQTGSVVTGHVADPLEPPDQFVINGLLSADGRSFVGTIDAKDPTYYDWSFIVTASSDWTRFEGQIWVIGVEHSVPSTLRGQRVDQED